MRLFSLYIVLILVLSFQLKAQFNYVPNYSFEDKDSCPSEYGGIDFNCRKWFTPTIAMNPIPNIPFSINGGGSSDYFTKCAINSKVSTPKNNIGFQYCKTGDSYAGINLVFPIGDYKEYIEVKLVASLTKNRKYCVSFFYSIGNSYNYHPFQLGALLTDTLVTRLSGVNTQQPQNIYATPQVSGKLPQIMDTLNWIKVSGSFIAKGGEQYLTIGNFQHTDTLSDKNVYVYIDDVKLYFCGPDTTPQPTDSIIIPNVFTPNGDGYNDKFEYKNQEQWEFETQIFSRWGNLVFDNKNSENWDGFYQGERVSAGVYFYVIKAVAIKTGEIRIYKGTVTVMY